MRLTGPALRQQIGFVVAGDPRFRVEVPGVGLLCPWCLTIAFPNHSGQMLIEAIAQHVEFACPVAQGNPHTPMMTHIAMGEVAHHLAVKEAVAANPAFRVSSPDGRWVCPYCAQVQNFYSVDTDQGPDAMDRLTQKVKGHLGRCHQCREHPQQYFSMEELSQRIAVAEQQREYRMQIAALMKATPIMQFYDADGHWVCPYCQKSIDYVDMSTPAARTTSAPARAAKHLSSECPVAKKNPTVSVSMDQMSALVQSINSEKSAKKTATAIPGDTEYLKALSNEVLALRHAVKKNQALAQQVERAQAVQRSMLPKEVPTVEGYEFATLFEPCDQVSGDFYDAFRIKAEEGSSEGEPHRVAMLIGDVSGHGLEAALVMGMAKKAFSLRASQGTTAMGVISRVNSDVFPDLQEGTFLSASFSILDATNHSIEFTRAGHNPGILLKAATGEASLINPSGMIVGVDIGPRFDKALREEVVPLDPGDMFLQYTDGVTEAMNKSDEEFGLTRLSEVITQNANQPAEILVNEIHEALKTFMGERASEDDVTLLLVRRLP